MEPSVFEWMDMQTCVCSGSCMAIGGSVKRNGPVQLVEQEKLHLIHYVQPTHLNFVFCIFKAGKFVFCIIKKPFGLAFRVYKGLIQTKIQYAYSTNSRKIYYSSIKYYFHETTIKEKTIASRNNYHQKQFK